MITTNFAVTLPQEEREKFFQGAPLSSPYMRSVKMTIELTKPLQESKYLAQTHSKSLP